MDAELRALVHKLAADPRDRQTSAALARAFARAEGSPPADVEALPVPPELTPGALVLVVRPSRPRRIFAWPEGADAAIGRTGRVRAVAPDRLSCEIEVAGVGRFHAGAASLYPIPDARGESESEEREVFAEPLRAAATDLGQLGGDGLTEVQRALVETILAHPERNEAPLAMSEIGPRAGFVAENNRESKSSCVVLPTLQQWRPSVFGLAFALVGVAVPDLLGGEVLSGLGAHSIPWTDEDLWVTTDPRAAKIRAGLPWAVVVGLRAREITTPPHNPREVSNALLLLLEKPGASLDQVLHVLPGPDFGTGHRGEAEAIRRLYKSGSASLQVRTSFEIELPLNIIVTVPEPAAAPTRSALADAIEDAVRASRVEGVDSVQQERGSITVQAQRGADLLALRRRLENLLPREREVHYKLPMPLLPWLRSFLDHRRQSGASDAYLRRAILAARPPAPRRNPGGPRS